MQYLVLKSALVMFSIQLALPAAADEWDKAASMLNIAQESHLVPATGRAALNFVNFGNNISTMQKESEMPRYSNAPHVVYARGAADIVAGKIVYPAAAVVIDGSCLVDKVACAAVAAEVGSRADNAVNTAKDAAEDGVRWFDAKGQQALERELERRANGEMMLDDYPPIHTAHAHAAKASEFMLKLLEGEKPEPTSIVLDDVKIQMKEQLAGERLGALLGLAELRGAGLKPAERDAPWQCLEGKPYWEGGCFDGEQPPMFEFADGNGPRYEDRFTQQVRTKRNNVYQAPVIRQPMPFYACPSPPCM